MTSLNNKDLSFNYIHTALLFDPVYGVDGFSKTEVERIYKALEINDLAKSFKSEFSYHPLKSDDQLQLLFIWILFLGLPVRQDRKEISINAKNLLEGDLNFDINSGDLKLLLDKYSAPLPGDIFPLEKVTTKNNTNSILGLADDRVLSLDELECLKILEILKDIILKGIKINKLENKKIGPIKGISSQSELSWQISQLYSGYQGFAQRTLHGYFSSANKAKKLIANVGVNKASPKLVVSHFEKDSCLRIIAVFIDIISVGLPFKSPKEGDMGPIEDSTDQSKLINEITLYYVQLYGELKIDMDKYFIRATELLKSMEL